MTPTDRNEELLDERRWLTELLDEFDDAKITDTGLGMGEADFVYERDADGDGGRRRVSVTIRLEEIE